MKNLFIPATVHIFRSILKFLIDFKPFRRKEWMCKAKRSRTLHGILLVPPGGGTNKSPPPYPLVPPAQISVLTLVPPNPRVLKTGTKNRY